MIVIKKSFFLSGPINVQALTMILIGILMELYIVYLQSSVVGIFDVTFRASSSDCVFHYVSAQIDLSMERLAIGLVHRIVNISNMGYDGFLIEDMALLAQFATVHHVIVGHFVGRNFSWSFGCRKRQSVIVRCVASFGLCCLLVLDREMLSQIRQTREFLETDVARKFAVIGGHRYAFGYRVFISTGLVDGLLVLVQNAHVREHFLANVTHDRFPSFTSKVHSERRKLSL